MSISCEPWDNHLYACCRHWPGEEPLKSRSGTPVFMAPEVIMQDYSHEADVWSVGILMYHMLTGRFPFWDSVSNLSLQQVMSRSTMRLWSALEQALLVFRWHLSRHMSHRQHTQYLCPADLQSNACRSLQGKSHCIRQTKSCSRSCEETLATSVGHTFSNLQSCHSCCAMLSCDLGYSFPGPDVTPFMMDMPVPSLPAWALANNLKVRVASGVDAHHFRLRLQLRLLWGYDVCVSFG